MARQTMTWLIKELRRKVYDIYPQELDSNSYYMGNVIRLECAFSDFSGNVATVGGSARVDIWDANNVQRVTGALATWAGTTGKYYYDYQTPVSGVEGIWRFQYTATQTGNILRHAQEFVLRRIQRIWSDDELQNYLDRHRVWVEREQLAHSVDMKRYFSSYRNFDEVTLYLDSYSSYTTVPMEANLVDGSFVFSTAQAGYLYLSGWSYNIYLAAAECLEELAGDPSRAFSWSRGGVTQQTHKPLELAQYYRQFALANSRSQTRLLNKIYFNAR